MEKDKRENHSKQLLIWGTLLMIAAPFIVLAVYNISLSDTADIGEVIGGITSPVAALLGSILVYFALSAQIDSNKILAVQIEEDKINEQKQKEEAQVSNLYNFFSQNILDFTFEDKEEAKRRGNNALIIYKGGIALDYFVAFLQNRGIDPHDDEKILENRDVREFVSIIKSADLLIDAIKTSSLDPEDKQYYKSLVEHQLTYKISPNFDSISEHGKKMEMCQCGLAHGTFPATILHILIDTKEKLDTI